MEKLKAAVVQFQSDLGQVMKNAGGVSAVIGTVMKENPDCSLIVFPEVSLHGYAELDRMNDGDYDTEAGRAVKLICDAAGHNHVSVVAGFGRRDKSSGKLFNSIACINRLIRRSRRRIEGSLATRFRI